MILSELSINAVRPIGVVGKLTKKVSLVESLIISNLIVN